MKDKLFNTNDNLASTILRIALGSIVLIHGSTKLGDGFAPFEQFITGYLELPALAAYATVFIETASSLMLILGVAARVNAIAMFVLFIGMIVSVHGQIGFMMNWSGQYDAGMEGYEYHLLVLAICGGLIVLGGGRFSADHYIQKYREDKMTKANNWP
ncbi:DoxX family protein [Ulvibacterium sp.]|uniref:DoxX family protein n=1 Tax=Ulvibacterium sp. TaxID=2665914 RepID=UPI00262276FC|nr:DoxX family protein [Ulvibacterium sp.]